MQHSSDAADGRRDRRHSARLGHSRAADAAHRLPRAGPLAASGARPLPPTAAQHAHRPRRSSRSSGRCASPARQQDGSAGPGTADAVATGAGAQFYRGRSRV